MRLRLRLCGAMIERHEPHQDAAGRELLFVSPRFLFPVDSGGKIRTTQILRGLKGGRYRITLASSAPAGAPERHAADLATVADRCVFWPQSGRGRAFGLLRMAHLASSLPVSVATDRSAAGRRIVATALSGRPAVVVFDFPHSTVLAPAALGVPSVLFTHNVEAEIFARHAAVAADPLRRWIWRDQHRKMRRFESRTLGAFDTIVAVSQRDAEQFATEYGRRRVDVINTGVDLRFFDYRDPPDSSSVAFSGSMDWLANVDGIEFLMDDIWPAVARALPQARMCVVGRSPPDSLVEAARARDLRWTFSGFVDDVRPYVHAASVFVIPLRVGGGTRLKVFEAMAMGCPVVSTTIGVEGLPLEDGVHYLRADTAEEFSAAIRRLLGDGSLRQRLARAARAHVEQNFSHWAVAREFERICARTERPQAVSSSTTPPT